MKILFSVNSLLIRKLLGLIIVGFISVILGLFAAKSLVYSILFVAFSIVLVIIFYNPRAIIVFLLIIEPYLYVISQNTALSPGNEYFSINITGILSTGVAIFGTILLFFKRAQILKYRLTTPMLIFLGMMFISVLYSPLKLVSLRYAMRYTMPFVLYLIILEYINDTKQIKTLLKFALLVFIPSMFAGFWQIKFGARHWTETYGDTLNRIYGLALGQPNVFSILLLIFSLLTIFYFAPNSGYKFKWVFYTLFLSMMILLYNTYSRISWITIIATLSVGGFFKYRKYYSMVLLANIIVIVVAFVLTAAFYPSLLDKIYLRMQPDASFEARFTLQKFGLELFKKSPIWGHGVGSFQFISFNTVRKEQNLHKVGATGSKMYGVNAGLSPHNDYIRFLTDGGIIALGAYLSLMYKALKLSAQIYKLPDLTIKNYGIFLITLVVMMLVFGLSDQAFNYAAWYFFIFIAFGEIYLRKFQPQHIFVRGR